MGRWVGRKTTSSLYADADKDFIRNLTTRSVARSDWLVCETDMINIEPRSLFELAQKLRHGTRPPTAWKNRVLSPNNGARTLG